MIDPDTFLTPLYVMIDDYCKAYLPPASHPGPQAALSRSANLYPHFWLFWYPRERG
jgi:hypothetical protein